MTGCGDPGGPMDVGPHVPLVGAERRTGVDPDPNPDRCRLERRTRLGRGRERTGSRAKGDKEGVPLSVDLDAVVTVECGAEQSTMLRERFGVGGVTETVQQAGRSLDVREQESDGSRRQLDPRHSS